MRGNGRREELAGLAGSLLRVLFVYALVLQVLAPLAVAHAEGRDGYRFTLCSVIAEADRTQPVEDPVRIAHDCLSCCLGSVVAALPVPMIGLPQPARFPLRLRSVEPEAPLRTAPDGGPPPQRAPPSLV
ncbi:hypothetical protein [Pleomorphomonas sp. JP5]|uniref:hypothetical protein n=1 Tax=Pleomorphomonas sp. JP5 TaxID=2942998 RepID=UPI0020448326|nr:hypothetical protein [Pleomorphomonas sp. JP5]MCM5558685.1 hypothetical protein [Pleomorphomonas sp. JP5]